MQSARSSFLMISPEIISNLRAASFMIMPVCKAVAVWTQLQPEWARVLLVFKRLIPRCDTLTSTWYLTFLLRRKPACVLNSEKKPQQRDTKGSFSH